MCIACVAVVDDVVVDVADVVVGSVVFLCCNKGQQLSPSKMGPKQSSLLQIGFIVLACC